MTSREGQPPSEDQLIVNLINDEHKVNKFGWDDTHGRLHPDSVEEYKLARQSFQSNVDRLLAMHTEGQLAKTEVIEEGDRMWLSVPHPRGGFDYRVSVPFVGPKLPTTLFELSNDPVKDKS